MSGSLYDQSNPTKLAHDLTQRLSPPPAPRLILPHTPAAAATNVEAVASHLPTADPAPAATTNEPNSACPITSTAAATRLLPTPLSASGDQRSTGQTPSSTKPLLSSHARNDDTPHPHSLAVTPIHLTGAGGGINTPSVSANGVASTSASTTEIAIQPASPATAFTFQDIDTAPAAAVHYRARSPPKLDVPANAATVIATNSDSKTRSISPSALNGLNEEKTVMRRTPTASTIGYASRLRSAHVNATRNGNSAPNSVSRGVHPNGHAHRLAVEPAIGRQPTLYCCGRLSWRAFCAVITLLSAAIVTLLLLLLLFVYGRAMVSRAVDNASLQMIELNITRTNAVSWTDYRMDALGTVANTAQFDAIVQPMTLQMHFAGHPIGVMDWPQMRVKKSDGSNGVPFEGHSLFSVTETQKFSGLILAIFRAKANNQTVTLQASGKTTVTARLLFFDVDYRDIAFEKDVSLPGKIISIQLFPPVTPSPPPIRSPPPATQPPFDTEDDTNTTSIDDPMT